MKRLLAAMLLAGSTVCVNAQDKAVQVSGTAPDGVKMVYFYQMGQRAMSDSATVNSGKFSADIKVPADAFMFIYANEKAVAFIADGTPVVADMGKLSVTGSATTVKFNDYSCKSNAIKERMYSLLGDYRKLKADTLADHKAEIAEIEKKFDAIDHESENFDSITIAANKDNILPAFILANTYYNMSFEKLNKALDPSTGYYNHPLMDKIKSYAVALAKRQPGKMFMDLSMNDLNGKPCKLSDWCGKGNYVLIDFWASWCGPCRAEMPNVVANYKKYHSKGFEIVGVSFDSKAEAWQKAVKDLGLEWPQISDLKGWKSAGATTYGINGIPSSVLVDGTGKIIALDLRGEFLGNKLKEIYGF